MKRFGTDTPHPAFMIGQPSIHCPANKTPAHTGKIIGESNLDWYSQTSWIVWGFTLDQPHIHILFSYHSSLFLHEVLTVSFQATSNKNGGHLTLPLLPKVPTWKLQRMPSLCEFVEHHRHSLRKVLPNAGQRGAGGDRVAFSPALLGGTFLAMMKPVT